MHYAQRQSPTSKAFGIGLVVLLHLAVGYALITGLGTQFRRAVEIPPPVVYLRDASQPDDQPVSQKDLQLPQVPEVFVPRPVIEIATPAAAPSVSKSTDVLRTEPQQTAVVPPPPARARDTYAGTTRVGGPELIYPPRLVREGRTGWVDVQCDVDETGRTSQCAVTANQGGNGFVEEALKYVTASRYNPATHNGAAVTEAHHNFHIVFDLKN